jgi:hypothetical protein
MQGKTPCAVRWRKTSNTVVRRQSDRARKARISIERVPSALLRKCGPDQFVREDPNLILEEVDLLWPNAARERYLLTKLPECECCQGRTDFSIAHLRSHVLKVYTPDELGIYEAWSWSRYDDEDQLFFLQNDTEWDVATIRLLGDIPVTLNRRRTYITVECMFYAVGWSDMAASSLQCALVDYRAYHTSINEVQQSLFTWNHNKNQTLETLIQQGVPKSSFVAFEVMGTANSVLVTYSMSRTTDSNLCRNEFWGVEFRASVIKTRDVPAHEVGGWNRPC